MEERLQKTIASTPGWPELKELEKNVKAKGAWTEEVQGALRRRSTQLAIPFVQERTGLDLASLTPAERKIVEAVGEYVGILREHGKYPGRTLEQLKNRNLRGAAEIAVAKKRPTQGYKTLADANLEELSYEQIVVDHPEEFTPRALWFSRRTLGIPNRWPDPPAPLDGKRQQATEKLLTWLAGRARAGGGLIEPFTNEARFEALGYRPDSGKAVGTVQSRVDFACFQLGLPPLGQVALAPYELWKYDGKSSWTYPAAGMTKAARERGWLDDDFERLIAKSRELPEVAGLWVSAEGEQERQQWAAQYGSTVPGEDPSFLVRTQTKQRNEDWVREEPADASAHRPGPEHSSGIAVQQGNRTRTAKELSRLQSPAAIQVALNEFSRLGRSGFLERYGFGKSRDFLIRNPLTGELCDSKAIVGAAYGYQFPEEGALAHSDFSGGEATVERKLQSLGFEVVRIGEDWSAEEVDATVAAYFQMLQLESQQAPYKKTEFNLALRQKLRNRSKASVELKHQNISAVLQAMELPFIPGYKPRGNSQLLLRKSVQQFVLQHAELVRQAVDALEEDKTPAQRTFKAVLVAAPAVQVITAAEVSDPRVRLPRRIDFAARDEANRRLGRAGEQWAIDYEHQRLIDTGRAELLQRLDWISDRLGDGAGYDILSYDAPNQPRYIEVKTTNGAHASSFIISRNELDFSREAADAFFLYRVFQFRQSPALYILQGDVTKQLHLEPTDYRASFRRLTA